MCEPLLSTADACCYLLTGLRVCMVPLLFSQPLERFARRLLWHIPTLPFGHMGGGEQVMHSCEEKLG